MPSSKHSFTHGPASFSSIPMPAWWLPSEEGCVYGNEAFQAFTGAPAQFDIQALLDWVHPSDIHILAELLQNRPQQNSRCYYRLKSREGSFRWHCHNWSSYSDENSKGFLSLLQDIHELYSREAFYKSRFEEIFNETFQFAGLLDREGRLLEVNKSALAFGDFQAEDILGRYIWQVNWWESSLLNERKLQKAVQAAATGTFIRSEERVYGKNTTLLIDFSLKPLYNESGELLYIIAEGRDITELKNTRNQLKASENKWRTLVENTPDIIARHHTNLSYTFINPAIKTYTGLSPHHFIGKKPEEVALPQAQVQRYKQALLHALSQKQKLEYSAEVQTKQGLHSMLITISPELNEQEEVESLLVLSRDISELKEKERQLAGMNEELRMSNVKLRNILDSTKDAICSRDMDLRLLAYNKTFEEEQWAVYGRQPRVGETLADFLGHLPADLQKMNMLWQRALQGEAFTILQEFGDPRYSRNYYELTFNPIYDDRNQQVGATIAGKDVTRERKIEKELKDAREFLILAENIPHIIFTTDPLGRPDYHNQAFYEYTGIQDLDLSTSYGTQFIHPSDFPAFRELWERSVSETEGLQHELRLQHRSGAYRWNLLRFIPLETGGGNVYKWIGSATDIHEAKVAEEKQRLAAQEFRQLAESLPLIIWTTDPQGQTNYLNNKWYEYTGIPLGDLSVENWRKYIHPDDFEQTLQRWEYSVAEKEEYLIEYRLLSKQGEYRWFLVKGTPLTTPQGEVLKWFGSSTDIHDQKLQNKRLWQKNLQLNQINQYLDNFVHSAAHDLRAPIANMKGLLSLFDLASAEGKKEQILENLKMSAERLDTTLQGMIQLIEAQNQSSDISQHIDIEAIFRETLEDFKSELSGLELSLDSDFSGCRQFTFVLPYLRSIFRNLLSNSIKYRKQDHPLRLKVNCRREDDFVVLCYQDNGIGIDMEKFGKNLFRPFKRFTQQASGKGIGLHIVKNMLVKTGGKITVDSSPGKGVCFTLYLRSLYETQPEELSPTSEID